MSILDENGWPNEKVIRGMFPAAPDEPDAKERAKAELDAMKQEMAELKKTMTLHAELAAGARNSIRERELTIAQADEIAQAKAELAAEKKALAELEVKRGQTEKAMARREQEHLEQLDLLAKERKAREQAEKSFEQYRKETDLKLKAALERPAPVAPTTAPPIAKPPSGYRVEVTRRDGNSKAQELRIIPEG